jgi:hypothetical protein
MVIPHKIFKHEFIQTPKVELVTENTNNRRLYRIPSGKLYPSVTNILGELPNPGLDAWRKRVGQKNSEKIANAAAGRGKLVHSVAEAYLLNQSLEFLNPFQKTLFKNIQSTLNCIDNIRTIEKSLYSDKLRLAGTPDCIADYGNILSIIDFKTSTKIKEERYVENYFIQCGAYAIMYNELFGILPEQVVILIAVEESNFPQVFKKDSMECFYMLKEYVVKLYQHRRKS